jgi:hypothetical protein
LLQNLNTLIDKCQNQFGELNYSSDVQIDEELKALLIKALANVDSSGTHVINPFSITFIGKAGLRADVPSSGLWYALCFSDLYGAIFEYKSVIDEIKKGLRGKGYNAKDIDTYLKQFPSELWGNQGSEIEKDFIEILDDLITNTDEKGFFIKFMSDRDWWIKTGRKSEAAKGKTLDRSDVYESSIALACNLVVANSSKLKVLINAFNQDIDLKTYFSNMNVEEFEIKDNTITELQTTYTTNNLKAINKIYYGAPGTGKSHRIDQVTESHSRYVTVFHPDTQYSDLVGALKPVMVDVNGEKKISYKFRPGPFTKALIEALNDTNKHVYLVIEELNRAPAAAVFGEIFQLLDRNAQGESQYKIEVSDPDMLLHIKEHLNEPDKFHKLYLPSNFSILATMNSSDQSVMPMDTAFKRRWLFEYLPIDFIKAGNGNFEFALTDGEKREVPWKVFAEVVNDTLSSLQVPEDRLLGHRFVSDNELTSIKEANNTLKGKILVYLWDDVLRHGKRDVIFNTSEVSTFGQLSHKFGEGAPIFSETFETKLLETLNSAQKAQEVAADEQAE